MRRLISFYKGLINPIWDGQTVFGGLSIDEGVIDFILEFDDELDVELVDEEGEEIDLRDLDKYSELNIKFTPPRKEFMFFAEKISDMLESYEFKYEVPDEFYIADLDVHSKGFDIESGEDLLEINMYFEVIKYQVLLNKICDHDVKNAGGKSFIFLTSHGKEEISIEYDAHDLKVWAELKSAVDVEVLSDELFMEPHVKSKTVLYIRSFFKFIANEEKSDKFRILLCRFEGVKNNYIDNYDLFLSEFSFDDEIDRMEMEKQTFMTRINEVLSGVHGKLISIPISLVIVAGQMKPNTDPGFMLLNSIILFGAFTFFLLMMMLTANQLHTLQTIKQEYDSKKERIKLQVKASLYGKVSTVFGIIDKRYRHQRIMILLVDLLTVFGLIFSLCIYEYHSYFFAKLLF